MTRAIQAEPTGGGRPAVFSVLILFLIEDPALRERIAPDDVGLGERSPIAGHPEVFRFAAEAVADEQELDRRLAIVRSQGRAVRVLVISDRFVRRDRGGGLVPTELAGHVRALFRTGEDLCGMVALVDSRAQRVSDIDVTLARDAGRDELRAGIVAAATGLRLKAPPPERCNDPRAKEIRVEVVRSPDQLRACLALRKKVYGLLGYLPDDVMADRCGVEMDGYDIGAIHFAAMHRGQVVGTARLVAELPNDVNTCSGIDLLALDTHKRHRDWAEVIARRSGRAVRARAMNHPYFPLPILQSSDFTDRWAEMLEQTSPGAELSRLVVDPGYRGLRISRNLVRMTIAKSVQLNRSVILLECIPAHVAMYADYGFRPLSGDPHSRPTDLDQLAIGMWFRLDESQRREKAEKLLNDIKMKFLPAFGPIDVAELPCSS